MEHQPRSCDTFVCLPPMTANGDIIFGKNSDRPAGEVQEIIYQPRQRYQNGAKLRCTYIEIDQVSETVAIILSKPSWMWGAEMGANEHGVCIGNEAVWTKLNTDDDLVKRLLGMDLVRLGLERSKTVREALDVITVLLELHGQGGSCSDTMPDFTYHNSFLIADRKEAWVLETAGKLWAAEHVTAGYRHISNELSIGTKTDLMSAGLKEKAASLGFWNPASASEFHFAKAFSAGGYQESGRVKGARRVVTKLSKENSFGLQSMMQLLRDEKSGICMCYEDSFQSTSSQVSVLTPFENENDSPPHCIAPCSHWLTGTPDPSVSLFKSFVFCDDTIRFMLTPSIQSPILDPAGTADREHALYKAHKRCYFGKLSLPGSQASECRESLRQLELKFLERTNVLLHKAAVPEVAKEDGVRARTELKEIFNASVVEELNLYDTLN